MKEGESWYFAESDFIDTRIDAQSLKEKYGAENIIFFFFLNTGQENQVVPRAVRKRAGDMWENELVNCYMHFQGYVMPPASMAHEILHCFGAPDLYYQNDWIPQEYVDVCRDKYSDDIMYSVNKGDEIARDITQVTASWPCRKIRRCGRIWLKGSRMKMCQDARVTG